MLVQLVLQAELSRNISMHFFAAEVVKCICPPFALCFVGWHIIYCCPVEFQYKVLARLHGDGGDEFLALRSADSFLSPPYSTTSFSKLLIILRHATVKRVLFKKLTCMADSTNHEQDHVKWRVEAGNRATSLRNYME